MPFPKKLSDCDGGVSVLIIVHGDFAVTGVSLYGNLDRRNTGSGRGIGAVVSCRRGIAFKERIHGFFQFPGLVPEIIRGLIVYVTRCVFAALPGLHIMNSFGCTGSNFSCFFLDSLRFIGYRLNHAGHGRFCVLGSAPDHLLKFSDAKS